MRPVPLDIPAWFSDALLQAGEQYEIEVDGAVVGYRSWGPRTDSGLVLVHGGAAHARWWDHLAPMLAHGRRVVALDLTGHGDSEHRENYSLDTWSREVLAVAGDCFTAPPVVIGHSMGGTVSLAAAANYGSQLAGVIIIDTPVRTVTPEEMAARDRLAFGPSKVYPTYEAIRSRFRVIPGQETLRYILEHIADTSIREVSGGWTWKFDSRIFAHKPLSPDQLSRYDCRLAVFRPEYGLVDPDMGAMITNRLGRVTPLIDIPEAAHHVMLDQPLALVTGLRAILAEWALSSPGDPAGA